MIKKLLLLAVIIYLAIKFIDKKKGRKGIRRNRRMPKSELSVLRGKFHKLAGDGYFDPIRERDKLVLAFKKLSNSKLMRGDMDAYGRLFNAVKNIVEGRAKDAEEISSLAKIKQRFAKSGDTFSDGLRTQIETYLKRSDEILAEEHFAIHMDELQLIVRHLPWLIGQGEEGKDNSVHWQSQYNDHLEKLKEELASETGYWKVVSDLQ